MSAINFLAQFCRGKNVHISGRAARGLFMGKDIRFGNNVSFSNRKTRRSWKPNAQNKRLYSEILDDFIDFKVTTHALRWIDKAGGIDNFLLGLSDKRINSVQGLNAKRRLEEALRLKDMAASALTEATEAEQRLEEERR